MGRKTRAKSTPRTSSSRDAAKLPLTIAVDLPAAGSVLRAGGPLTGKGWVVSGSPVAAISVSAGTKLLGTAEYGVHRPDLAAVFPEYPNATYSGFTFSVPLDVSTDAVTLIFSARTEDGEQCREEVPVQVVQGSAIPDVPASGESGNEREPLLLTVDQAAISLDGELQVTGWAVANTELEFVKIHAGDKVLGSAVLGCPRPDVALQHSGYSNAAASGFSFNCPVSEMESRILLIRARAQGGITREAEVEVTVSASGVPEDSQIIFHCDHLWLSPAGMLVIEGWSTSPHGIDEIAVLFDDIQAGKAELGMVRPDIAGLLPGVAQAGRSGLRFVHHLPPAAEGSHTVTLVIRAGNGGLRTVSLPAVSEFVPNDIDTLVRLEIDSPGQNQRAAPILVNGTLRIEGWAIARAGVDSVRVSVGDVEFGDAYYGLRREDVAAAYPGWKESLSSGFGMSIAAMRLTPGEHSVRVVVRDHLARERFVAFAITVDTSAPGIWTERLAKRVSSAEAQIDRLVLSALEWQPKIALYMAVRESDVESARATLASLCAQEYRSWRLFAALPPSSPDAGRRLLEGFRLDAGSVVLRDSRQRAKNRAAVDSDATFYGVLRPGDQLGVDALLEIAIASGLDRDADFIYSDERRIDPVSGKMAAFFKPDWSPDLLLSWNYVGRLWLAKRALLRRAGVNPPDLHVAGDYELALSLTQAAHRVAHVPKVLCERGDTEDKNAERRALQRFAGRKAEILPGCAPGIYRFRRVIRRPGLVSIIIPTCGVRDLIKKCIASIRSVTANRNFEIICIENIPASGASTRRWVKRNADKLIRAEQPFNWSAFNNTAVRAASPQAEYYLFLNDDIEVFDPEWLDALLENGQRTDVAVTGALLLYPDRTVQHAGMHLVRPGLARHVSRFSPAEDPGTFGRTLTQRNVIAVTGACMLVRRSAFEALGGFDEAHEITNNDLDFCMRSVDRGLNVVYTPWAKLIHHEMTSRKSMGDVYNTARFEQLWRGKFAAGDPYYNRWLSRSDDHFTTEPEPVEIVCGGDPLPGIGEVRTVIAFKVDHIGDFITAFPAFRQIKRRFPLARLCVVGSTASMKLARLEPSIDEMIEFNFFNEVSSRGEIPLSESDLAALRLRLEATRVDIAIDLRKHPDTRELLRHVGAAVTAGFDSDSRFPWLDVSLEWEKDFPRFSKRHHIAEDLVRLVDAVATACERDRKTLSDSVSRRRPGARLKGFPDHLFDRPVVCVHPGSGNPLRTWPAAYFAELIDVIGVEYDCNFAIIGVGGETRVVEEVLAAVRRRDSVFSLAGTFTLDDLPLFLQKCALFVGNNSGPQHIAAGLGVPVVGIHSGVVDAREWAPIGPAAIAVRRQMSCSPCYFSHAEQCYRGVACLNELRPGDVLAACRKLLEIRGGSCRRNILPGGNSGKTDLVSRTAGSGAGISGTGLGEQ